MQEFAPKDQHYRKKVIDSFNRQTVMQTIGASIDDVQPGQVKIKFPYSTALTQQHGFIHAGIVSTVIDSACGYAAFSLMPAEAGVLSIEFKVNLLSPAVGEQFTAIGRVKKPGRTITVTEGDLIAYQAGHEKVVASMVATMMTIVDPNGEITG